MIDADEQPGVQSAEPDRSPASPAGPLLAGRAEGWVREHGGVLWQFLLARTRARDVAEELLQETILAAMQSADQFAGASSERTWLLGIATHKLADHYRRERRRKRAAEPDDGAAAGKQSREIDELFGPEGRWRSFPARWGERPDDVAERAELVEALRHCIEELPNGLADAVWMRDLLGMSSAEVCKALGLKPTNLWTKMYRARFSLRLCIEKAMGLRKGNAG